MLSIRLTTMVNPTQIRKYAADIGRWTKRAAVCSNNITQGIFAAWLIVV